MTNNTHALDGGIPSCFHIERYWPAASDVRRLPAKGKLRQALRMSLVLLRSRATVRRPTRPAHAPRAIGSVSARRLIRNVRRSRAQRAKLKSQRDDLIIAQGKRGTSAALGKRAL